MSAGARVTVTGSWRPTSPGTRRPRSASRRPAYATSCTRLDATLEPDGIRAVSVTVRGTLAREGAFTPDRVAEALFAAMNQDEASWRTEVPYEG